MAQSGHVRAADECPLSGDERTSRLKDARSGAYRTGRYSVEPKAERQAVRALLRHLRRLIDTLAACGAL
jgi:hypothetical protein